MVARTQFTQGETLCFKACGPTITSGKVVLVGPANPPQGFVSVFEAPLVQDGISWGADVDSSTFVPGPWAFEVWTVREGINRLEKTGQIAIKASLVNAQTGQDVRSVAERIVANIEAYLEGNSTSLVRRYKINNRELERHSMAELLTLLKFYRKQVKRQRLRASGKTGATFIWRM